MTWVCRLGTVSDFRPDLILEPSAIPPASAAAAVPPIRAGCFILLPAELIALLTPFTKPDAGLRFCLRLFDLFARERGADVRLPPDLRRVVALRLLRPEAVRVLDLADERRVRLVACAMMGPPSKVG
jgi:hypothetical protein